MFKFSIARVTLCVMAAYLCYGANAWGFGGGDKESASDRRARRAQEEDPYQGVETSEQARNMQEPPAMEQRRERTEKRRGLDKQRGPKPDRAQQMEEMKKMRSKNKNEMLSEKYTREVMEDDLLESDTPEDNDYLSDDEIHKLWAEHMHDFVPEDMINVIVEKKQQLILMEDIGHMTPTTVKGAYYVVGGNQQKTIGCVIYDPNREIVYKRGASPQGIIMFETTVPGEYTIIFHNMKFNGPLTVTLAFHTYEEERVVPVKYDIDTQTGQRFEVKRDPSKEDVVSDIIGGEDNLAASDEQIQNVRKTLKEIQQASKQIQNETKMSFMRQMDHNTALMDNANYNFYCMCVEVLAFGVILALQTHHMMKTMDNKLIL